jgi:hypothetical protein
MSAVEGDVESMKKVLSRLFYYCRSVFPYSEETIGVEQVASPLKILFIHAFQPYIQRYDCDDLTLLFMAFVECLGAEPAVKEYIGLKSMVRLAGAPDSGDIKFHVFPVVKFDRVDSSEYTHDVSAPTDLLYWQMNHGGNKEDYVPTVQSTYIPVLSRLGRNNSVAGSRLINL